MKKIALALISLLTCNYLFAATSGELLLRGNVPSVLSIVVTPETTATALPLDTTQGELKVATVTESCNSPDGYTVSIVSQNGSNLIHENNSNSYIAYTLKYGSTQMDLTSSGDSYVASNYLGTYERDVHISYTGTPLGSLFEGNYSDTLTFTITAN